MRVLLSGEGAPIPKEALPDPGTSDVPSLAFFLPGGGAFHKADYVEQGYTHYEAWCVGGCGGRGGDLLDQYGQIFSYGGAGGGGGLHKVLGLLSDLPDSCPVVVGSAGGNGADGGASSFNGATCQASGGTAGFPSLAATAATYKKYLPGGNGGQGGSGGRVLAGGGANGETTTAGPESGSIPSYKASFVRTPAKDGTWDGIIGKGGGGGRGGKYGVVGGNISFTEYDFEESGSGGKGSFAFVDTSVYGPGENMSNVLLSGWSRMIFPGGGGGAMINKLMGYGSRVTSFNPNGAVYIRLLKIV